MVPSPDLRPSRPPPDFIAKYCVLSVLGQGGMGVVYEAFHPELESKVAIKTLRGELADDPSARARFLREAQRAASIVGEHSTRIYDTGTDESGSPFIVMEFLDGESADARVERCGKLSIADACTVVVQLLDALAEAHAKGLIHRDIKLANLFLVTRPGESIWTKVLDFGIAKAMQQEGAMAMGPTLTGPKTILGSPAYMSPEQLRDASSVDARSDLWACGVVLFELLSGSMPFEGTTLADLAVNIMTGEPRALSAAVGASMPPALDALIARCLRKSPADRPQNAFALAEALAPWAHPSAKALLPRIRAWCGTDVPAPSLERSGRSATRPPTLVAGILLVALSGAAAFGVASLRGGRRTAQLQPKAAELDAVPLAPSADPSAATVPGDAGATPAPSAFAADGGLPSANPPPPPVESRSPATTNKTHRPTRSDRIRALKDIEPL